jgi:hypothetical protein
MGVAFMIDLIDRHDGWFVPFPEPLSKFFIESSRPYLAIDDKDNRIRFGDGRFRLPLYFVCKRDLSR